jgi:hypothetical protein
VLDGDWNTQIVVNVVTFMRQVGFIPPVIEVGVPNVIGEHGINLAARTEAEEAGDAVRPASSWISIQGSM